MSIDLSRLANAIPKKDVSVADAAAVWGSLSDSNKKFVIKQVAAHARGPSSSNSVSLTSPSAMALASSESTILPGALAAISSAGASIASAASSAAQAASSAATTAANSVSAASAQLGDMIKTKKSPWSTTSATLEDEDAVLSDDTLTATEKGTKLQAILFAAACRGGFEVVRQLLGDEAQSYINIDATDDSGSTALIYASCFGHNDIVLELLRYGAFPDTQDKNEWTALIWAISNHHEDVVRSLLENNASLDIATSQGRTALDFVTPSSDIYNYMSSHGYITSSQPVDFYDDGKNPLAGTDDFNSSSFNRVMLESAAYNLDVNMDHLKLDDASSQNDFDDDDEFLWDRCLPDQMFVFNEGDIPTILDLSISQMEPKRSKGQKPIPANILFLCARYAHYYGSAEILENLLTPAFSRIRVQVMSKKEDIAYLAFWLSNCSLLLYYLRKDAGLLPHSVPYQETLSELITDITILISQDAERRLDLVLDASILNYETLPGLNDIHYQSEWRFFKSHKKPKSHKEEMEEIYRPPSPKTKMQPSPRNVTSILGSVLFVTDLYEIHPIIVQELMSQLFYWLGVVLFNRVLSNRKYLARSRAMQIRLNVSAIEDWALANNRRPEDIVDEFHEGHDQRYPSLADLCHKHFTPLVQILQWLQIFTGFGSDFTNVVAALQQLDSLNPRQLLHVAKKYRAEVGEQGLSKEYRNYLSQLNLHYQKAASHTSKVQSATIHTMCAKKEDAEHAEAAGNQEDSRKSIDLEVPKILPGHKEERQVVPPQTDGKENSNGEAPQTDAERAAELADTPVPITPSASIVPRHHREVELDEDDDDDSGDGAGGGEVYLDASAVLPFVIPTLREMIVTWGRGFGGIHKLRAKKYEPTLPDEFVDKLDMSTSHGAAEGGAVPGGIGAGGSGTEYGKSMNPIFGSLAVPEPSAAKTWGDIPDEDLDRDEFRSVWSASISSEYTPGFAPFFGFAGCAAAIILSSAGAAVGTAKSGIGISGIGTFKPELIMKSLIPVIMSGILAVYGLVVAVLIAGDLNPTETYSLFNGFMHLACGLCVGFAALAAGYAIGIVGDEGVRQLMLQPRLFVGIVLILIFAEVLGLYGMIIALILNTKGSG